MKARVQSRVWVLALAVTVIAGCSAGAQEATGRASASMSSATAGKPGGTLVCYGERILTDAGAKWFTKIHPFNNNDHVSISIDRMAVYDHAGSARCEGLPSYVLAPHATLDINTDREPFISACTDWPVASSPGAGGFSIVLYWSVVDEPTGYVNGLAAYSDVYYTMVSGQFGWTSHACESIALRP